MDEAVEDTSSSLAVSRSGRGQEETVGTTAVERSVCGDEDGVGDAIVRVGGEEGGVTTVKAE